MDPERYALVADLLAEAIDRPESDRVRFLLDRCDDASIREEVLDLLNAESEASVFAEDRVESRRRELSQLFELPEAAGPDLRLPQTIGSYRVIRRIGEGGMGVVFEAEQSSPRRRVAVKVVDSIRVGSQLEQQLRREAEVQGRLQHPGIAQIYEAGAAQIGESFRPYFAMEYIDGVTLATYAESLDLQSKVGLLAAIASAVGHAHGKGVVHRDLKPDNILVLPTGSPKVLDFGIAQLMGDATIGMMTITQHGQISGTIGYMAPEQFAGPADRVGPQTDVYALGVISYRIIAGRPPFEVDGLSVSAAMRTIEDAVPFPLRSACLGIPRDLETIIHKCLDPDPLRRYTDGSALAADLRRFSANEPIVARPSTRRYRAAKFIRRNRALVGGVAATIAALTCGIIAALWLAAGQHAARVDAQREREISRRAELDAIRGVLAGSALLAERGDIWEATDQLYAIAPHARDWTWRHAALRLPWVVEPPPGTANLIAWRFIDDDELLLSCTEPFRLLRLDLVDGTFAELAAPPLALWGSAVVIPSESPSMVGTVDKSGRLGLLDARTGILHPSDTEIDQIELNSARGSASRLFAADRFGAVAVRRGMTIESSMPDSPTLVLGEEIPESNHRGPWWEIATAPGSQYAVLGRWAVEGLQSSLFCVDMRSNRVVAERAAPYGIPAITCDVDGRRVYARTPDGIDILELPELKKIGGIAGVGSGLNITASPAGGVAFVAHQTEQLHLLSSDGTLTIWPEVIGGEAFIRNPVYAPNGRLLQASSPGTWWPWIIDTANPLQPASRAVTPLVGHKSWVYQVAISPDGSLLASAAPQGDVLLWDLVGERLLARFERYSSEALGVLSHMMDAPLLFAPDSNELIFGEWRQDEAIVGLARIDLRTGARSWIAFPDRSTLHDALDRELGDQPRTLYHHAALLGDGRILESASSQHFQGPIKVRDRRNNKTAAEFGRTTALAPGGVAVHPSGRSFVCAEPYVLRVRDAKSFEVIAELRDIGSSAIYGVAYSPDGERLAIGTENGSVVIYETRYYGRLAEIDVPRFDGAALANPDPNARNYVYSLAWTPDGERLVCAGGSTLRILETQRPFVRDAKQDEWRAALAEAIAGRPAPTSAQRVATIERLVRQGTLK